MLFSVLTEGNIGFTASGSLTGLVSVFSA